ncbi:MAG: hypothetical protein ACRCZF_27300 [Gemmataceae bacterium]
MLPHQKKRAGVIEFTEATSDDHAAVAAAGQGYRQHWNSFRAMPDRGGTFEGAVADIAALDYLDYEQLGHPGVGLAGAALVWGNVLAVQTGLRWLHASGDELWLGADLHDCCRGILWPYARLAEAKARHTPQFGQFYALTLQVIEEIIATCDLPAVIHARLRRLQAVLEVGPEAVDKTDH